MVLQVPPDPRQGDAGVYPHIAQLVGIAYARQEQQLGRVDGSAAEQDLPVGVGRPLLSVPEIGDAGRA